MAALYVNLYRVLQMRGGPEEGGWPYDQGTPLESVRCETEGEARAAAARLMDRARELDADQGPGEYAWHSVRTQTSPGVPYPTERPRYE